MIDTSDSLVELEVQYGERPHQMLGSILKLDCSSNTGVSDIPMPRTSSQEQGASLLIPGASREH